MMDRSRPALELTAEQRRIVEWDEGPLIVIAGAGTGKTRVIVERVRRLLATHGTPEAIGAPPLLPEQILVLTYNVKAAHELTERLERTLGPAIATRLAVGNFHSFCHRVLVASAADAGLPSQPDVLDGVGQVLLLRDIRDSLPLLYYAGTSDPGYWLGQFVAFINRAKDEVVSPAAFDAFVAAEQAAFEERFGPYGPALERLEGMGAFDRSLKDVRRAYAAWRTAVRAADAGAGEPEPDFTPVEKMADREARRAAGGTGGAVARNRLTDAQRTYADRLGATYVTDAAALEVLRLSELAVVYHAYEAERERRGALDFGEQIAAVVRLFRRRPNVLRRWQSRFRYILVDEFQDANVAQIELIELLGRAPDRPDNVMVVGDDDQSIYRFRGASYAAFAEFAQRFAGPPPHDPDGPAPGAPTRLRIEENFRSLPPILSVANRLIERNQLRHDPDKRLSPSRRTDTTEPVELWICDGPEDEAAAIAERIRERTAWDDASGGEPAIPWGAFAILYRKHRHREAIIARLRRENIPYTVSGGLSLFATPEIRDLEQALRLIADPADDIALVRVLTAGPWRLDALELALLTATAKRSGRPLLEVVRAGVADLRAAGAQPDVEPGTAAPVFAPTTQAKLRRFLATLDALADDAHREGPFTILEGWLERSATFIDLLTTDTLDAKRSVANIAGLLRFTADWQSEHPAGTLAGFVDYLDAYQWAGGDLPTSIEVAEDAQGVRLMSLYQAKGLEYPYVFVPSLLDGEWPVHDRDSGLFPRELLREAIPDGDVHTEEERRLLYVAITRAQDGLVLTTHAGPATRKKQSAFVGELRQEAGAELLEHDRTGAAAGRGADVAELADVADGTDADGAAVAADAADTPPRPRERRTELRLRATELLSMIEGVAGDDPAADAARTGFTERLADLGRAMGMSADAARAAGLDPVTLRTIAGSAAAGADLLSIVALPDRFSYSQLTTYERCPMAYAFRYAYRIPVRATAAHLGFGLAAHAAFEAFTRARREAVAAGEPLPTRADLQRLFDAVWQPDAIPDRSVEATFRRRSGQMLDSFWEQELRGIGEAIHEELDFEVRLEPPDGSPTIRIGGSIDRVDRLPSGGVEIVDYKTGDPKSQKNVDENLQLSLYALAARDALGLGTPERVTLYFTERATRMSTARTDAQLDAARDDLIARVTTIRTGDFRATPSTSVCGSCDYRRLCPRSAV